MDLVFNVQLKMHDTPQFNDGGEACEWLATKLKAVTRHYHVMGVQNVTLERVFENDKENPQIEPS
jgi:hypothetical protein